MAGFHEGRIWIEQPVGSRRPGIFVGDAQKLLSRPAPMSPTRALGDQVSSIRNAARG